MFDKIRHFAVNTIAPRSSMRETNTNSACCTFPTFLLETTGTGGCSRGLDNEEGEDGARIYIYTYTRGKVTLLWYKLRYSAIREEDGDEEEEEEEG